MYISDELRVEGRLHSNGERGGGTTGGAGAGGSIYVVVGHLDGAGSIETFGGPGMEYFCSFYNSAVVGDTIASVYIYSIR